MPKYVFKSRDGRVKRVQSEKNLSKEELEELDYLLFKNVSMTAGDIARGFGATISDTAFSMGEATVDFLKRAVDSDPGNRATSYAVGLGPVPRQVIEELNPEYQKAKQIADIEIENDLQEISNTIREARIEARESITDPVPLRVQESFGYQAVNAIGQLGSQLATVGGATVLGGPAAGGAALAGTIIPLGYTIGKDDYYRSINKTPSTATPEELNTAESVGAINGLNTYALNAIGIRGIQKVFLKNKEINRKLFKLAEEGKLTKDSFKEITKDIGKAALREGFTEAADEASLNLLANNLFDYDPERKTLEGTGRAFALGSIGGGAYGTVFSSGRIGREGLSVAGDVAGKAINLTMEAAAVPLKSIGKAKQALSGVNKSLAEGTLKAKDMVRNYPLTAKVLDGLMEKGIDVSKISETISKKIVPITKESVDSLKNSDIFKKVKSTFDKVARPLQSQIASINENVGRIIKQYSYDERKLKVNFEKRIGSFLIAIEKIKKNNPEDYNLIFEGWHRSDNAEVLAPLMEKYGLTKEFQSFRQGLDSILKEARAEGVQVGELEDYLPRFVTNYEGLIKSLGIKTDENLMEIFLKRRKNPEEEVSMDEAAEFLERYILEKLKGTGKGQYKGIGTNPQKNRIIDNVSSGNVKYYADPVQATIAYVNRLATSITDKRYLRGSKEFDRNEFRNIEESDVLEREFENASTINVRSVYDEDVNARLSPTVAPDEDVDTRMRGKVSQNGLPLIIETPLNIKGVPLRFESNVDKALYVFRDKEAKKDTALRLYLRRQLDLKQTKKDSREIGVKSKEIVGAVNESKKQFKKRLDPGPDVNFDRKKGAGATPNQIELAYRGFTINVTPEYFRELVPPGRWSDETPGYIEKLIDEGKPIAPPFLLVKWNDTYKAWNVFGHEGRSRSDTFISKGVKSIPVDLIPRDSDGLDIKGDRLSKLSEEMKNAPIIPEDSPVNIAIPQKKSAPSAKLPKTLARGKLVQALVDEVAENRLDAKGTQEIISLLRGALVKTGKYSEDAGVAFGQKDFANISRGLKSFTTLAFLSSPLSTVTQLGDFAYNLFENKQGAFQGDKDIQFDLTDINLATDAVGFEFSSDGTIPGKLQKSIDFMFNVIGFRKLDEGLKVKFLNSTYNRIKKQLGNEASESSSKVYEEISRLMGSDRAQQVVDDVRAGKKSDIVAEFLFYKLSDIAPITKFDMPYWYLRNPNVRFLYALKSYTIKQLDFARRNVFKKIFSGNEDEVKEGLQNLFSMLVALMIANAPVEFIHAFMRKGDLPEMSDLTTENFWRLLGLNSYTGMIAKRDGIGTAAMGMVTPPGVSVVDGVFKDVVNFAPPLLSADSDSVRYIPIVGRTIYDWQDAFKED